MAVGATRIKGLNAQNSTQPHIPAIAIRFRCFELAKRDLDMVLLEQQ